MLYHWFYPKSNLPSGLKRTYSSIRHCIWHRDSQDHPQDQRIISKTQGIKSCYVMVVVYYHERIQVNINKGEKHVGQNLAETRYKFLGVSSLWGWKNVLNSLIRMCSDKHLSIDNEDQLRPWVQIFIGRSVQTSDLHSRNWCSSY